MRNRTMWTWLILPVLAVACLIGCGKGDVLSVPSPDPVPVATFHSFPGACEASAAVHLAPNVLWVADDEFEEHLFAYQDFGEPLQPSTIPLLEGHADRAKGQDIEGAAWQDANGDGLHGPGDVLWWTTSHSLSKHGDFRNKRHRLLAYQIPEVGAKSNYFKKYSLDILRPERGVPLLPELLGDKDRCPQCMLMPGWDTGSSKRGGLDIEGLAWANGQLYFGLRGPLAVSGDRKLALVLPVGTTLNASPVAAQFKGAWGLDLGGRGIRSLEAVPGTNLFLIVAGPSGGHWTGAGPAFMLYSWIPGMQPRVATPLDVTGSAEALVLLPTAPGQLQEVMVIQDMGECSGSVRGGLGSVYRVDIEQLSQVGGGE